MWSFRNQKKIIIMIIELHNKKKNVSMDTHLKRKRRSNR